MSQRGGGPLADEDFAQLVELLLAAEELPPPLTGERLSRLARQEPDWRPLAGRLTAVLRQAVSEGVVLRDQRHRLTARGQLRPVELYRLNYQHPRVVAMLGAASE